MAGLYYPAANTQEHVDWIQGDIDRPRILRVPIVTRFEDNVMFEVVNSGSNIFPRFPTKTYRSRTFPDQAGNRNDVDRWLYPQGNYSDVGEYAQGYITEYMFDDESATSAVQKVSFLGRWKAYNSRIDDVGPHVIGAASVKKVDSVDVKQLPHLCDFDIDPRRLALNPLYAKAKGLVRDNPIQVLGYQEALGRLEKLHGFFSKSSNDLRRMSLANLIVDIIQLTEIAMNEDEPVSGAA
jgi:hypothetical protein